MPRYGDDQCEECGAARVSRSKWCVDCLIRAHDRERRKTQVLQTIIDTMALNIAKPKGTPEREENKETERLVQEIENYRGMLEDAVWYGFKQNRKVADMTRQINELTQEIEDYNIQSTGGARRWKG